MPHAKSFFALSSLLSAWAIIVAGCGSAAFPTEYDLPTETDTPQASATPTATGLPSPTPTPTGSENVPLPEVAGSVIPKTTAGSLNPQLDFDGQARLSVFFQTADPSGGYVFSQSQLGPTGEWTAPGPASPNFQFLSNLTAVPDMSGRLCILWSGEQYDASGDAVYGLWRNCEQVDGTWQAQAQQPVITTQPAIFAPARAKDGALVAAVILPAGPVEGVYFSPIGDAPSAPLTSTLLSGSRNVLMGRLAVDAAGGYHAAWVESTDPGVGLAIEARDSTDGGKTWTAAQALYTGTADNPAEISFQLVADAAGNVHLAWDGDSGVHYRRWTAAGWGEAVKLSGAKRSSGVALAAAADGTARAVWTQAGAPASLLLRVQAAGGDWGDARMVSAGPAYGMTLAVDTAGAAEIVWRADDGLRYTALP